MQLLKKILIVISVKTVIVAVLACIATYLCRRYELIAEFPLTLIATAVVFPIVFSISGAYKRRENALLEYSIMKAHGRALYLASRDWLAESSPELQAKSRGLLKDLFVACRELFENPIEGMEPREEEVYRAFSRLSTFIKEDLRGNGLASGEVSRCNQYLSKMMIAFEDVKHIYQYRTPRTLRAFSDIFVTVLPVVYGPYFAEMTQGLTPSLVYVMPVLFAIVLVSLANIQDHLENPFDQIGEDDIAINAEKFADRLELV